MVARDHVQARLKHVSKIMKGLRYGPAPTFTSYRTSAETTGKAIIGRYESRPDVLQRLLDRAKGRINQLHVLAFFPLDRTHEEAFASTTRHFPGLTIGTCLPGAVGAVCYHVVGSPHQSRLAIRFVQGCFRQQDEQGNTILDARVLKPYSNWQHELLRRVFAHAEQSSISHVSYEPPVTKKGGESVLASLTSVAKQYHFSEPEYHRPTEVHENGYYLVKRIASS